MRSQRAQRQAVNCHSNSSITISGFYPNLSGGPQVTAPLEVKTRIFPQRIDKQHQSVGIVVGVIDSTGRRTVSYGKFDEDDKRPVDADTIFEIGSVTKVFTSLLLADMVQRGEVALDPVAKYLPSGVKMPERNGRQITLEDLATHTSGLPRLPSNLHPKAKPSYSPHQTPHSGRSPVSPVPVEGGTSLP